MPFGFNSTYFTSVYLHSFHFPFIYFNPLRVTLFQLVPFHDFTSPRLTKHRSISVSFFPFGLQSPYFTSIYLHSFHFPFIYFNLPRVNFISLRSFMISIRLRLLNIAQFLFPSFHLASAHPTLLQFTCIPFTSHSFTLIHFESLYFSSFSFISLSSPLLIFLSLRPNPPMTL